MDADRIVEHLARQRNPRVIGVATNAGVTAETEVNSSPRNAAGTIG